MQAPIASLKRSREEAWNKINPIAKKARHGQIVDALPKDVIQEIFKKLTVEDLGAAACVSKRWRDLIKDKDLWKEKIRIDYLHVYNTLPQNGPPIDWASLGKILQKGALLAARISRINKKMEQKMEQIDKQQHGIVLFTVGIGAISFGFICAQFLPLPPGLQIQDPTNVGAVIPFYMAYPRI